MRYTTTPAAAAIRDAARDAGWTIERDDIDGIGRILRAQKNGNHVIVRFGRSGGITRAAYNDEIAHGPDRRGTVVTWLYRR